MNVASVTNTSLNVLPGITNDESIDQDYAALIAQFYPTQEYKTRDEINAEDTALAQFKDDLITKGAALFLKELNEEKIEALVEEYRQKLLKEKEQNPDKPMDINQMVSDFRKQLLKEMMEAQKADQENRQTQSAALTSQDILENLKAVRNDEQKTGIAEIGFLEQMLNTSNSESKKKSLLF
ncbi:hypothetical protein [Sulfuricurvum sp.]|jgi:hypothetical protein|uniref:hypothetical protein n=1 Tax=Sulfuricurvum sp. TaxID=2025608 RepID=UPI0026140307|nr:hypothetical protein [Sulfuricurvum sp.]MDD2782153.1 hypothetical protein [Sulfuricurvum sp.]